MPCVWQDDLGAADVSFNAKLLNATATPAIPTPGIDWLARHGIALSRHYTHPSERDVRLTQVLLLY